MSERPNESPNPDSEPNRSEESSTPEQTDLFSSERGTWNGEAMDLPTLIRTMDCRADYFEEALAKIGNELVVGVTPEEKVRIANRLKRLMSFSVSSSTRILGRLRSTDPAARANIEQQAQLAATRNRFIELNKNFQDLYRQLGVEPSPSVTSTEREQPVAKEDDLYQKTADELESDLTAFLEKLNRASATDREFVSAMSLLRKRVEDFQIVIEVLETGTVEQRRAAKEYKEGILARITNALTRAEQQIMVLDQEALRAALNNMGVDIPRLANVDQRAEALLTTTADLAVIPDAQLSVREAELDTLASTINSFLTDPTQPLLKYGSEVTNHLQNIRENLNRRIKELKDEPNKRFELREKLPGAEVRDSLYKFMGEIGVPFLDDQLAPKYNKGITIAEFLTKEGLPYTPEQVKANLDLYFSLVSRAILKRISVTVLNKSYDSSVKPYVGDYRTEPFRGPARELDVGAHPQVYDRSDKNTVLNFGSFFDQFKQAYPEGPAREKASDLADRLKRTSREISIWHNRAYVFRDPSYIDRVGPDGSLKALQNIDSNRANLTPDLSVLFKKEGRTDKERMTDEERKFSQAVEFCMAIWSYWSLTKPNQDKLRHLRSAEVARITDNPEYDHIGSTSFDRPEVRVAFIEDVVKTAKDTFGIPQEIAELAYHIGETYRIGASIETALDRFYVRKAKVDSSGNPVLDSRGNPVIDVSVKVPSVGNGAAKGMYAGEYAEYADNNPERPDYLRTYGRKLAKTYPTFADAWQTSHSFEVGGRFYDISGWGDNRATLAELLSVEGAVNAADWSARERSSSPDSTVSAVATQSIMAIWPRVSISSAKDPKNSFFVEDGEIHTSKTRALDSADELALARQAYNFPDRGSKLIARLAVLTRAAQEQDWLEMFALNSSIAEIGQAKKDKINSVVKDMRAYWLDPLKTDVKTHPLDAVRLLSSLFTRDGRPVENKGYVHPKIGYYIEQVRKKVAEQQSSGPAPIKWDTDPTATPDPRIREVGSWVEGTLFNLVNGYITYDVLMTANLELFQPDVEQLNPEIENVVGHVVPLTPDIIRKIYDHTDFSTYKGHPLETKAGYQTMHSSRVHALIMRMLGFRDMYNVEGTNDPTIKLRQAGYSLAPIDDVDSPRELEETEELFSLQEALELAQSFNLGEGYHYRVGLNSSRVPEVKLIKDNYSYDKQYRLKREKPDDNYTIQDLLDRVALLGVLFGSEKPTNK